MTKEPPVWSFEQIQDKKSFSTSSLSTYGRWKGRPRKEIIIFSFVALVRSLDEAAILEVKLCIHDDVYMNVQRTGRLGLLLDLDCHLFAYSAAVTMEPVIIGGQARDNIWSSEIPPWRRRPGPGFSPPLTHRGDAYCWVTRRSTSSSRSHLVGMHALRRVGSEPPRMLPPPLSVSGCSRPQYREQRVVVRPQRAWESPHTLGGHIEVEVPEGIGSILGHPVVSQYPVVQYRESPFVLVGDHSSQIWLSDYGELQSDVFDSVRGPCCSCSQDHTTVVVKINEYSSRWPSALW